MARVIRNIDDLQKALMPELNKMVDVMADKVYKTLNTFLQEYYDSYDPLYYRRQYDFLRSAVKVKPKTVGNQVIASVYIDYESMNNYGDMSGLQVVKWANEGLHGGKDLGTDTPHVWDDTIENTVNNGELLKAAVDYLKSRGIKVQRT